MALQTCSGGLLHCSFGSTPGSLIATPKAIVSATRPAANIMDHQPMLNVPSFGLCSCPANPAVASATAAAMGVLTPMPCMPNTPAPWAVGMPGIHLGGFPALDNESSLMCVYGGLIRFASAGQATHRVGKIVVPGLPATGAVGARRIAADQISPNPASTGESTPYGDTFGKELNSLLAKSPTLRVQMQRLKRSGWKIEYGTPGSGSYVDRDAVPPQITIDGKFRNRATEAARAIAHEAGHATYEYQPNYSSKQAYVQGALADEGAATLNNLLVQREIMGNGGPDIGIAGNAANRGDYNRIYDQFLIDGNVSAARNSIGKIFGRSEKTSTTGQSYANYHGDWYDKTFTPQK